MLFHQTIKDHWPVIIEHLHDRIVQIIGIRTQDTFGPKRLGQFHKVGQGL